MVLRINQLLRAIAGGGVPQIVDLTGTQPTDRFVRADSASALGTTTTGQAWTSDSGTWGLTGGRAYMVAQSGDSLATFNSGLANVDLSCDFVYATDGGIIFRQVDVNDFWLVLLPPATNRLQLYKRTGVATYTQVANPLVTLFPGTSYNLRVTASGNTINVFLDDTLVVGPITDATFNTATRVGIRQNAAGAQRWMNILAKPIGAATERRVMTWAGDIHTPGILRRDTSSAKTFVGWANPSKEVSTLAVGDQWARVKNNGGAAPVNVILDTDFSSDVDDVFDLKACIVYHAEGMANLLGVAVTTSRSKAPGAAAAVLRYYGYQSIPVASYAPLGTFDPGSGQALYDAIYDTYDHTGYGLASTVTDTTTALGAWLASASNVVYVMTGFAKALRAFLSASAGNMSLFASAVSKIVAVAGLYPNDAGSPEFNLASNADDWNWLTTNSPVPIVWIGIEIGNAIGTIGGTYMTTRQAAGDITRFALDQWGVAHSGVNARNPWGVVGVHYAVEGFGRYFATQVAGTNAINASTGSNTFTAGAGTQAYVTTAMAASLKNHHNSIAAADVAQGIKTWNGSAWA